MLNSRTNLLLVISLSVFLGSCSFVTNDSAVKSESYTFDFNLSDWSAIDPDDADHAYSSEQTGSIITINSLCQKYQSSSLAHLVSNMLGGIENVEIEKKEELEFAERKAFRAWAKGMIDGVHIYLVVQTLRKNNCLYDFILISTTQENRKLDLKVLNQLLDTVEIN